jgi:hypothetical protein
MGGEWNHHNDRTKQKQTNSIAFSPQVKYTNWAMATSQRILAPTFVDRWVSRGQRGRTPTAVKLSFLDRSRYFSSKYLLVYADEAEYLQLLRKSSSAGNRTRDPCACSQELWLLDHRGDP